MRILFNIITKAQVLYIKISRAINADIKAVKGIPCAVEAYAIIGPCANTKTLTRSSKDSIRLCSMQYTPL